MPQVAKPTESPKADGPEILDLGTMAELTGVAESYLGMCIQHKYLCPETHACSGFDLVGGQEVAVREAIKEHGGIGDPRSFLKRRKVSARENFRRFGSGIGGRERLLSAPCAREILNISRGFQWWERASDAFAKADLKMVEELGQLRAVPAPFESEIEAAPAP